MDLMLSPPPAGNRLDRFMRHTIRLGAFLVISLMIIFIFYMIVESVPLFVSPSPRPSNHQIISQTSSPLLSFIPGESAGKIYSVHENGTIGVIELENGNYAIFGRLILEESENIIMVSLGDQKHPRFSCATSIGRIIEGKIQLSDTGSPFFESAIIHSPRHNQAIPMEPIQKLVYRETDNLVLWCGVQADRLFMRQRMNPDGEFRSGEISGFLFNQLITSLELTAEGYDLMVGTGQGEIFWFRSTDFLNYRLVDNWKVSDSPITHLRFLAGNHTLIIADSSGKVTSWLPVKKAGNRDRYQEIHAFVSHGAEISALVPSAVKRFFLTGDITGRVHVNYATGGHTIHQLPATGSPLRAMMFTPAGDGFTVSGETGEIKYYRLNSQYPEVSARTLLGKVWYEGYDQPQLIWQSTGGWDEYEPKYSLIPLFIGTLKGTFYALIFSIPLALLAAIYISQFAPHKVAKIIKPAVEIAAAFPSVVIGFVAGIFLAPLLEKKLMEALTFLLILFLLFLAVSRIYRYLPEKPEFRLFPGHELLVVAVLGAMSFILAGIIAPVGENFFFDGSLLNWLYAGLDIRYDQRNSLLVGFALGFAIIPMVFTIAEDALRNVPGSIISGSIALGASRLQTIVRIVIPAALSGILSAVLVGIARAIGETMIVLMVSGNTPVMDLNPFTGFRSLSATIAIELPEALPGGTLYRVLFLMGLLLFLFSFVLNSIVFYLKGKFQKKYAGF